MSCSPPSISSRYDEVGVVGTVAGSGLAPTVGPEQMPTKHSEGRDGFIGLCRWEARVLKRLVQNIGWRKYRSRWFVRHGWAKYGYALLR
jgi:hypothetical protein